MKTLSMVEVIKIIDGEPQVVEDSWVVQRDAADDVENSSASALARRILPFSCLIGHSGNEAGPLPQGVWISPDEDFESHAHLLRGLELIAVDFPSFRDGRGYSIAYLLRTRYGWSGELRAIGDVLRDQLNYMRRCGFNSFALRADKDIRDALKSFSRYSVQYQGAVDQPLPLFRRRNTTPAEVKRKPDQNADL